MIIGEDMAERSRVVASGIKSTMTMIGKEIDGSWNGTTEKTGIILNISRLKKIGDIITGIVIPFFRSEQCGLPQGIFLRCVLFFINFV